jgi:hypothetical protein
VNAFCSECGGKVTAVDKFCSSCGVATKRNKNWADNQCKNLISYLGMRQFAVQTLDVNWKNQFFGPQGLEPVQFIYPPKPQHIRFCKDCEKRLGRIGWNVQKEEHLCSECVLGVLKERISWMVPLTIKEFEEDGNSIRGCVVSDYDRGFIHIDGIERIMKKDKKLRCWICSSRKHHSLIKPIEKGDIVFTVSRNYRSLGSVQGKICEECQTVALADGKILKKNKNFKQILQLKPAKQKR